MLDLSYIPSAQQSTQIFYATSGSNSWQTWNKPRGAKFIQIFCVGGGGSGGSAPRAGANQRSGGGGGAAAGIVRALFPAFSLPDILYIQPGAGGASVAGTTGVSAGANGIAGGISYVSMAPTASAPTIIVQSSATTAGGGTAGGQTSTSAGGTAPTVWGITTSAFSALGVINAVAGLAGGVSANATTLAVTDVQALGTSLVTGGAGGGSQTSGPNRTVGGSILSASVILLSKVNGGSTEISADPGQHGYGLLNPFCGTGGAGGTGQSGSFVGGRGGDGWYGCGGGGGGTTGQNSTAGTLGGASGKGGDGIVMITTIY